MPRHEYSLSLRQAASGSAAYAPVAGMRRPSPGDAEALAALMIDAYRDTIDYDGETLDDARGEIARYFDNDTLPPLLNASWVLEEAGILLAACLAAYWPERQCPLIAYVMTRAAAKRQGIAGQLVALSLGDLASGGYAEARAVITEGNEPSERLFSHLGFQRLRDS